MKSKYLALGLSALLVLSLASCGGQQTPKQEEPKQEEPKQEVQQAEPISAQPVIAPEEVKQEVVPAVPETEPEELSGDALIDFFKLAYKTSDGISYLKTLEEKVNFEIEVLGLRAENENKGLPADYADQYRAWRPVEEVPPQQAQQVSEATQNQDQGSNQQQNQSQSQQNQSTTQQTKPSTQTQPTTPQPSGGKAMYDGFNTYDEYIQDLHRQFPEYSIEQIKEAFPDQAQMYVGEAAKGDAESGLLNGG